MGITPKYKIEAKINQRAGSLTSLKYSEKGLKAFFSPSSSFKGCLFLVEKTKFYPPRYLLSRREESG
jgi:hypothetical protein